MNTFDKIASREREFERSRDQDFVASVVVFLAALLLLLGFSWILPSYFEAKTYRKLTGANVSMWDAMWVELRVQEAALKSEE